MGDGMVKEMAGPTTEESGAEAGVDPFADPPQILALRDEVRALCMRFPDPYWRDLDRRREYPEAFIRALTEAGWLAALIPPRYGGLGYGLREAAAILQEINQSGAYAGPAHAQMYVMGTLLRHGSEEQKARYLPSLADGTLRLQAFAVTEPGAGTDTTRIETTATRDGDGYLITGRKMFISRVQHSDLMVLLARTSPRDESRPTAGLSLFLIDLREAGDAIRLRPLRMMMNNETNEVTIEELRVPASTSATAAGSSSERRGTPRRARSSAAPSAPTRESSFRSVSPGPRSRPPTWWRAARRLDSTPGSPAVQRRTLPSCWRLRRAGR